MEQVENRDNVLTRNEAIDLFHLIVLIEQNLEYQGMNSKWQNIYATDLTLNHGLYYSANNLIEQINKNNAITIIDNDDSELGNLFAKEEPYKKEICIVLLKKIILSVNEVVNFRGELLYKGRLEISAPLLGDTVALKSRLGAMIFD